MKTKLKGAIAVWAAAALLPLTISAGELNLGVNGGSSSGSIGGASFSLTPIQPTGTGVIDPFLRIQQGQGVTSPTAGYNTDNPGNNTMQDLAGIWTHSVLLANVGRTADGLNYVFLLDANQTGSNPALTLSEFRLFVSAAPAPAGINALTGSGGLVNAVTEVFSIGNNNNVNFAVQNTGGPDPFGHGSGSGDLYVYVPVASLTGTGTYLTLYSEFGGGAFPNNDGFEEWATRSSVTVPDAGTTLMLLGMGLMGVETLRRKLLA